MAVARRAAVLGKPIAHSLSPAIHQAGYTAAGLTGWSYTAIECAEAELPGVLAGLGPEWAGLSVTMPLKEAAAAVADDVAPVVAAIGAANTLVRQADDSWYADNTDVTGMVAVLVAAGVPAQPTVTVLGAGGTARAALAAAARLGAVTVTVMARRPAAVADLRPVAESLAVELVGSDWSPDRSLSDVDIVISTVPAGAADSLVGRMRWQPESVVLDVLYAPWPTRLAAAASDAGCRVIAGRDLLLAQAVDQFELFTGVDAPREQMRAALE